MISVLSVLMIRILWLLSFCLVFDYYRWKSALSRSLCWLFVDHRRHQGVFTLHHPKRLSEPYTGKCFRMALVGVLTRESLATGRTFAQMPLRLVKNWSMLVLLRKICGSCSPRTDQMSCRDTTALQVRQTLSGLLRGRSLTSKDSSG